MKRRKVVTATTAIKTAVMKKMRMETLKIMESCSTRGVCRAAVVILLKKPMSCLKNG